MLAQDAAATAELLERLTCVPRIVRGLNRRLGRPLGSADCEDTVQTALTSIWSKLDTYRPERRLGAGARRPEQRLPLVDRPDHPPCGSRTSRRS